MSDFTEFKDVLNGFEKSIEYECSDPDLINSIFKDIRDMVEPMIQKRDERIKELGNKPSPKVLPEPVVKPEVEKPEKVCPPGKIVNPKTGRCINKPKEKTHKNRGRPRKNVDKPEQTEKPKKECPPGKIVNPKTGRCINKPKEKTHKRRGRPKKSVVAEVKTVPMPEPEPEPEPEPAPKAEKTTSLSFDEALEHIRTSGKPGSYRTFLNGIKRKFGITLKYDNHGDDYAEPTLYFMKGKKEASIYSISEVKKYVIDSAEKLK